MKEKKEIKITQEIIHNINEKYNEEGGEDELIEQESENIRWEVKMQSWKESKQMLMIIIPILIITYIGMKIFFNYLVEKHQKEKATEALKIEQELKKN